MNPRAYLLERFETDAAVLRARATALRAGPPQPGPDAATSDRMAEACEDVVALLLSCAPHDDEQEAVAALVELLPLLEQRASAVDAAGHCATARGASAPVRAVYLGAATRIREVRDTVARHVAHDGEHDGDDHDLDDGDDQDA